MFCWPCGPIEYADTGTGLPLLMIHGAGGGFDQGLALAAAFAPAEYRVVARSRFGYLRTPVPDQATSGTQADAHACLLDALGLRSVVVIGVSAGATSALEFALRHADRSKALILVVPGWYPASAEPPQRAGALAQKMMDWALRSDFIFWAFARAFPGSASRMVLGTPPDVVATASPAEQARVARIMEDILQSASVVSGCHASRD
jgi:pimeloyl-ACP methyl ester carboxylesterase